MADDVRVMVNKKYLEETAKAIRWQRGETEYYHLRDMPEKIMTIEAGMNINLADVVNHGAYVNSSNPYYNTTSFYTISSANPNTSKFYFDNTGILRGGSGWDNARATISTPVDKRVFSKVCVKAVIMDRTSTQYSNFNFKFGVFKKSRGHTYDGFDLSVAIGWNGGNYAGTSPFYKMPETVIKLDVSSLSENFYYIRMQSCDFQCKFTEMWLEP